MPVTAARPSRGIARQVWLLCLLPLLVAGPAPGATPQPPAARDGARPKVGLVLSGGGARGAAHIGVIEVLEELRVPIDFVAGTSMGAVVGGLYASGIEVEQLRVLLDELPWDTMFTDRTRRRDMAYRRKQDDRNFLSRFDFGFANGSIKMPTGLIQGQKLELELGKLVLPVATVRDFDALTIPFRAVATDIATGQPVVLSGGELADAIRASMAIPAAFAPVELDGRLLVDGGSVMNLPVEVARQMGADVVIAIDISTPLRTRDELNSALAISGQTITMQIQSNTAYQIGLMDEHDVLIRPDLGQVATMSFDRVLEAADHGAEAARAIRDVLSRLSVDEATYAAYRASLARPSSQPPMIDSIRVDNQSGLGDDVIRSRLTLQAGKPLDTVVLSHDIDILYGLQVFDHVNFRIDRLEDGRNELVLVTRERATGRNRVRLDFELETDFVSNGLFNIGVNVTRQPLNSLAGEWRNELSIGQDPRLSTEIWQPIDDESRWFVAATGQFRTVTLGIFDETLFDLVGFDAIDGAGTQLAEYRLTGVGGGGSFGRQLGQWGEVRAGIRYEYVEAELEVGLPGVFRNTEESAGELYARFALDTLDDARFPREGSLAVAEFSAGFDALGSATDYQNLELSLARARTWGENTAVLEGQAAFSFEDETTIGNLRALGGFLRLSGLKPNERLGTDLLYFRIRGYRRVANLGVLSFAVPAYVGISLEAGNTWFGTSQIRIDDFKWGGSLYFALDTPLAPVYVAYGNTNGSRNAAYFFVGQVF